jgi:hypothetical protein
VLFQPLPTSYSIYNCQSRKYNHHLAGSGKTQQHSNTTSPKPALELSVDVFPVQWEMRRSFATHQWSPILSVLVVVAKGSSIFFLYPAVSSLICGLKLTQHYLYPTRLYTHYWALTGKVKMRGMWVLWKGSCSLFFINGPQCLTQYLTGLNNHILIGWLTDKPLANNPEM